MSPNALRKKYLPRARKPDNTAAHQPAARAAGANQVQHRQTPHEPERKTKSPSIPHRTIRLTPFKPGFEMETEHQVAHAFSRPPRMFKEDTPFYPWLPRPTPIVNFHLNYKF